MPISRLSCAQPKSPPMPTSPSEPTTAATLNVEAFLRGEQPQGVLAGF
jgi:hypothetical protein